MAPEYRITDFFSAILKWNSTKNISIFDLFWLYFDILQNKRQFYRKILLNIIVHYSSLFLIIQRPNITRNFAFQLSRRDISNDLISSWNSSERKIPLGQQSCWKWFCHLDLFLKFVDQFFSISRIFSPGTRGKYLTIRCLGLMCTY